MMITMVFVFMLTPIANAESKITLKSGAAAPSTIYAGHSYTLKVAGKKVEFYSNDEKVATINKTTGKMKAVAPGSVRITARKTGTDTAVASKTFKVLQRAESVACSESEVYLTNVGDTKTLKATLTPKTSTDIIRFESADEKIVTVGAISGKLKAVAKGITTINIYAKATKATENSSKNNRVASVKVYVGSNNMECAYNTRNNTIHVILKGDGIANPRPDDFVVARKDTNVVQPVKEVKVTDKSGRTKELDLELYNHLIPDKVYTLEYGRSTVEFTAVKLQYTVTFVDEDGTTELQKTVYDEGTAAADIVKPDDPTKAETDEYTYTFAGWRPAISKVTGDATYRATYTGAKRQYTVTFVDEDGTSVLQKAAYDYGTAAADIVKPDDPIKAKTDEYTYTFAGWSPAIKDVTGDATYRATYTVAKKPYTVTFVDEDGTSVLKTATYDYGTAIKDIKPPTGSVKTSATGEKYKIKGWEPALAEVTGDATYQAFYTRVYTITVFPYPEKYPAYKYSIFLAPGETIPLLDTPEILPDYSAFDGWEFRPMSGSGSVASGDNMPECDVEAKCKWVPAPENN